jgi:putative tricarboxylic transport membrane protein
MAQRRSKGQIAVSAGVVALGVFVLVGAADLPAGGGYAQVGPGVVPRVVGAVLLLLGAMLLREALTGGFRGVDEDAEELLPMDWGAFAWVTAGIVAYGLLVERAGFLIASTLLFVAVARGFASRRWLSNSLVGIAVAAFIFAIFNYALGLQLPAGILKGILP